MPIKEYFAQLSQHVPGYYKLAKVIPSGLIKKAGMIKMAYKEKYGTQTWIKNNITPRVTAYYGSHENWKKDRLMEGIQGGNAEYGALLFGSWI